jgi:hypothetical protein
MPISTSNMNDSGGDNFSEEFSREEMFDTETLDFPGLDPATAETLLKRLGGGVAETQKLIEGMGWRAHIQPTDSGVNIEFDAHDELIDDLIRRFEDWVDRTI